MKKYVKLEKISDGTYGAVYKARNQSNGNIVALKKIHFDENEGIPATSIREIALLKQLQHECIVRLQDVITSYRNCVYLVLEYFPMDLGKYLDELPKSERLDSQVLKNYVRQIIAAILFCHQRRVIHRDLKPRNLLIDLKGTIKLADFGLSRTVGLPTRALTHEVLTLWYRAPEVLLGSQFYSMPIDLWSIGCIFFEMATRKVLFPGDSEIDQLFRIFRVLGTPTSETWPDVVKLPVYKMTFPMWRGSGLADLLPELESSGVDLLTRMLTYDPNERISAREAIQHGYITA
ncbi:hypothetical protein V5799_021027 [Amblyomma americanum]|uniref:cyclin-dependent kinase n=1 Tax=Amblyomma americanum TaxID=6943 RepID=A0AAQ4FSG2_AMBAM